MRYVIALGGNALDGGSIAPAADMIAKLYKMGNEIAVTHGNGPQVGALADVEQKSLSVLTAQTEAEIGLAIENALGDRIGAGKVVNMVTRIIVDRTDPGFKDPEKPIGRVLSQTAAKAAERQGFDVRKTLRGFRRVVASPKPIKVLEATAITKLLASGFVVVCAGGGGVPLALNRHRLDYTDAVLDKDRTASLLARTIKADRLVILTDVDGAYTDFKTRKAKRLGAVRVAALAKLEAEGQFERGSMGPKVEACLSFTGSTGKKSVIASLSRPWNAVLEKEVTVVSK